MSFWVLFTRSKLARLKTELEDTSVKRESYWQACQRQDIRYAEQQLKQYEQYAAAEAIP